MLDVSGQLLFTRSRGGRSGRRWAEVFSSWVLPRVRSGNEGKRWDGLYVFELSFMCGISRLLACFFCHLRFDTLPGPCPWASSFLSIFTFAGCAYRFALLWKTYLCSILVPKVVALETDNILLHIRRRRTDGAYLLVMRGGVCQGVMV